MADAELLPLCGAAVRGVLRERVTLVADAIGISVGGIRSSVKGAQIIPVEETVAVLIGFGLVVIGVA